MGNKRGLLISGCGAWDAYSAGTLARLNNDYDVIITTSTGGLLAPYVALKEWEILKHNLTQINNRDIFDYCWYKPNLLSKSGRIRIYPIIMSLLFKNKTIGTSNVLRKSIDEFFPESYYNELKKQNKEILIGTQNFAEVPPKLHFFSSISEKYEEFKDWMWCGSNFSFTGSLVKKSWHDSAGNFHVGNWNGGGLNDFMGVDKIMSMGLNEIDVVLSRPRFVEKLEGNRINNLIQYAITTINALKYNMEFEHYYNGLVKLNKEGVRVRIFWLPRKLSDNYMVYNHTEMTSWWDEGYNTAFDGNRVDIFEPIKKRF